MQNDSAPRGQEFEGAIVVCMLIFVCSVISERKVFISAKNCEKVIRQLILLLSK